MFVVSDTHIAVLSQDRSSLAVPCEDPCDCRVLELGSRDLSGEGAIGFVENILGSNLDTLTEVLAAEKEVKGWRRNDNLYEVMLFSVMLICIALKNRPKRTGLIVKLSIVQMLDNVLDA